VVHADSCPRSLIASQHIHRLPCNRNLCARDLKVLLALSRDTLTHRLDFSPAGADCFADFRTIDQINAKLDSWVAARPDLVSTFVVGTSLEGRIIRASPIFSIMRGSTSFQS
jgi:hypothetical protein